MQHTDQRPNSVLLKQENNFTEAVLGTGLAVTLEAEMKGRIAPDDQSVPQRWDGFWYYSYRRTGKQYRVHCRSRPILAPLMPMATAAAAGN